MKQSIVEVIMYLLETASVITTEATDSLSGQIVIKQRLEEAGFPQEVVANAFDWLKELIEQQQWYAAAKIDNNQSNNTLRIFDVQEKAKLGLDVRNFILSLECSGILDTKMREIVISQLMQLNDYEVDLVDAKWVILLVLMGKLNRNIQDIHSYLLAIMTFEV